jgi:hypothetical protein
LAIRPYVPQVVTIERLERAMALLAFLIERDGDVHLPMFERLEKELNEMRHKAATRERARAWLRPEDAEALKRR